MFTIISKEEKEFIGDLYNKYYPLWYKTAFNVVNNEQNAKDIINDVFIRLISKSSMLKSLDRNALFTYVVTSIVNACKTFVTKENQIEKINYDDFFQNVADNISVESTVLKNIEIDILRKVILKLDTKERMFVIHSYYEGLDDKAIAKEMQMPYANTRMYRFRLLSKIRKIYKQESAEDTKCEEKKLTIE